MLVAIDFPRVVIVFYEGHGLGKSDLLQDISRVPQRLDLKIEDVLLTRGVGFAQHLIQKDSSDLQVWN